MSATPPFPPRMTIVSYLAKHPETCGVYLENKEAVYAVAHFFAGRDVTHISLNAGIALTQYNAKLENKIPLHKIAEIQSRFTIALKDCKERKPLPDTILSNGKTTHIPSKASKNSDLELTRGLDIVAISYVIRLERRLRANL